NQELSITTIESLLSLSDTLIILIILQVSIEFDKILRI
ncbi:MAG: hypothetical protein RLZZ184_4097, partial [Cyanobacteriota bacterium]